MELFTTEDFRVFDIKAFGERMAAIATRIRPKLTSMGGEMAPKMIPLVDRPLYVHVARHARRTVNPPDDTWAAIGGNPRGYKADVHFKIAVSRHCVRFLFEVGPEYYAKAEWARGWRRDFSDVGPGLQGLVFFENEHDEEPALQLRDLPSADLKKLAGELTRRKDGQFVLGRRVEARDFVDLKARQVEKIALDTFKPLAPLFGIHEPRNVGK